MSILEKTKQKLLLRNYSSKTITKSEEQTINLGKKLACNFIGGETIGLIGELGAGKTILIKGIAKGLNIKRTITSPTFVLMKVYKITNQKSKIKNLVHVDAYRLDSGQDLINIGLNDWIGKTDTVVAIEWADRVRDILPKKQIIVKISSGKEQNERIIKMSR